jgi:hypothetical protein
MKGGVCMYCYQCGVELPDQAKFCSVCGVRQTMAQSEEETEQLEHNGQIVQASDNTIAIGFSERINDPAFVKYIKNTKRWAAIFSVGLALVAVVGFTIAGEMGVDNMENPQAFFYGLGVGGMFILIALYSIIARKRSRTWDGVVIDKTVTKKRKKRSRNDSSDDYYYADYLEYLILIHADDGKIQRIVNDDDDTIYNYYRIGDRVRHHGGLNSYEKYDKSGDSIIFCSACATLCDIKDDTCFRCGCPLLK